MNETFLTESNYDETIQSADEDDNNLNSKLIYSKQINGNRLSNSIHDQGQFETPHLSFTYKLIKGISPNLTFSRFNI